ncbi:MAG: response regulator transcription factor, partial [Oscillospiraceae bacterium]|nr:response regulator transcription factor [Oscillospiraceae bacterium]
YGRTTDVHCLPNIEEGLKHFFVHQYCLVVIDVLLLDGCGFSLLSIMRRSKSVPILALVSGNEQYDKVAILNSGADGFLMKPFNRAECQAIVDALLRRYVEVDDVLKNNCPIEFGKDMIIEPQFRLVTIHGTPVDLTRKEYDILCLLARRPYQVFTRVQIYDLLWDMESFFNIDDAVRFHVQNLRRKLKMASPGTGGCIETVWGVGYRFNPATIQT